MGIEQIIAQTGGAPVTIESLTRDLQRIGLKKAMTVIVHSSLSSLGWVCGGAQAVIAALENVLGDEGTLIMPAHSGDLSDPAFWENPPVPESWWQPIREQMPPFQKDLTPVRSMGAIAETFRKQSGVRRSDHPQLSFCAWGRHADFVTTGHALENGLGDRSPLARIYDLDGWVLLIGVGFDNNTSIHLAEYRADYPAKKPVKNGAPVLVAGERAWVEYEDINLNLEDFAELGSAFIHEKGLVKSDKIGLADALLMPQRPLVDYAAAWFSHNRR